MYEIEEATNPSFGMSEPWGSPSVLPHWSLAIPIWREENLKHIPLPCNLPSFNAKNRGKTKI